MSEPAERPTPRELLESLLDIWDDRDKPDEYRTYVPGAFTNEMERVRAFLNQAERGSGKCLGIDLWWAKVRKKTDAHS